MGEYQFQLSKVVGAREAAIDVNLERVPKGKQGKTKVHIHAEEQKSDHGQVAVTFKPMVQFKLSSPDISFFVLNKNKAGNKLKPVYRSECQKGAGNTKFNEVVIDTHTLCNNDDGETITIQVFNWQKSGAHKQLSTHKVTLGELRESVSSGTQ